MAFLRYATPNRFVNSANLQVNPFEENSPESNVRDLITSYQTKVGALRKIQSRRYDEGGHILPEIVDALIKATEDSLRSSTHKMEETLKTCSTLFVPKKRLYLAKGYVDRLWHDTLPILEVASVPVIETGEYVLRKIKDLGGPSIEITIPEDN